jgi:hypothetical protein
MGNLPRSGRFLILEGFTLHFFIKKNIMALYYDLPVFKDVYKLTLLIYSLTKDFSKEYKYTLGQDIKKDVMVLMRSIYRANKAQNKKNRQVLIPRPGRSLSLTF